MRSKDKLLKIIERYRLLTAAKIFGDIDTLFDLIGEEITPDLLIEFIAELTNKYGLLGLGEGNWEEPIIFRSDNDEEHQIIFLGHRNVGIDIVVGYDYDTTETYNMSYFNLPPRILRQICKVLYKNIDHLQ